jgi:membrane fusion protein (multidrug efflux system)
VTIHPVKVGERAGTKWVIKTGLKPGDHVVVEGQQALGKGMAVSPKPYKGSTGESND